MITLLLAMLAMPLAAPPTAAPVGSSWKTLARGLEMRVMDGGSLCRKGSRDIVVVRAKPRSWRLDLFLDSEGGGEREPKDIDQWQKLTGASVIINAGQFYPNRSPMGLFVKEGRNLGTKLLKSWKGILAAEPDEGKAPRAPRAVILDLEHDAFDAATSPYRIALQSFMMLDREGKKRVRRSDWHANRTVVAVDRSGRLLLVRTEGAYTLWELADWLYSSRLGVTQAMSLDGGFESEMCVRAGGVDYLAFGRWSVDDRGDRSLDGVRAKLPATVGLFPRK